MAFTVADALRTWDTDGPGNALRQGYALGLQRAQAQDTAIRDRQRLEQEAVRLAEQQKTNNYNRVFDQLKFGEEKRQFEQQQRLRELTLGRQIQNDTFDQSLIQSGRNPNTGQSYMDANAALYPPGYGPSGTTSSETAFPPIPESSGVSSKLPPLPDRASTPAGLPDGPVEEPQAALFPGNEIKEPPGAVVNVLTDMPGNPGVVTDTTLVEGAPPAAGVSFGNLPAIAESLVPETTASTAPVSEADRIIAGLRERQNALLTGAETAAGEARESANAAMEARSMARSRQLPADSRQAWMQFGSKEARTAGEAQTTAQNLARDLTVNREQLKVLEERKVALDNISPLRGVLPEEELSRVEKAALNPKISPTTAETLKELEVYTAIREANGWTHPSKSVDTARTVARVNTSLQSEKARESRQADEEAVRAKRELDEVNARLAASKSSKERGTLETEQKTLASRYEKLYGDGLYYRGLRRDYEEARKADVRKTSKEETPPATATPAAPVAAAPATAAKTTPGKSLVMDWIETVRKTAPTPVAGPAGARPGIDFPVNRGY